MAGIQAQTADIIRNILHDALDFVGELDVGACVRMNDRTHAPAVCSVAHSAHVLDESSPLLVIHARCAVGMACVEVALVMTPIHNRQVRRRPLLSLVYRQLRHLRIGDELADVIDSLEYARLVFRRHQIVEDGADNDAQTVLVQLLCHEVHIVRDVAPRAKLDGTITCLTCFGKHAGPRRQIRVFRIVYAPAARSAANVHAHNHILLFYHARGLAKTSQSCCQSVSRQLVLTVCRSCVMILLYEMLEKIPSLSCILTDKFAWYFAQNHGNFFVHYTILLFCFVWKEYDHERHPDLFRLRV